MTLDGILIYRADEKDDEQHTWRVQKLVHFIVNKRIFCNFEINNNLFWPHVEITARQNNAKSEIAALLWLMSVFAFVYLLVGNYCGLNSVSFYSHSSICCRSNENEEKKTIVIKATRWATLLQQMAIFFHSFAKCKWNKPLKIRQFQLSLYWASHMVYSS